MTSHSGERPFRSEHRPGGGDRRPHRADQGRGPGGGQGGRPGFNRDSRSPSANHHYRSATGDRPGGHFKKREFRPRPH
jgi:hypothetical protein